MTGPQVIIAWEDRVDVTVVTGEEDWQGLYLNGALVHEDHSIRPFATLEALTGKYVASVTWVDAEIDDGGRLPVSLADVRVVE